jgi:hypothetical protein
MSHFQALYGYPPYNRELITQEITSVVVEYVVQHGSIIKDIIKSN